MARLSDHDVRDAEHALRTEIALILGQYARRMAEVGKAYIQEAIEEASQEDRHVNGVEIGRAAAARAAAPYFGGVAGELHEVVDGGADPALNP